MRFKYTEQAIAADRKLQQVAKANNEYLIPLKNPPAIFVSS